MGKGFNNYMCKKFFHPASRDNLKRVWMAEQRTEAETKKQDDLRRQYEREQELYQNRAILSKESKEKLEVNFMYEPPPGARKEDRERKEAEENEREAGYKFEWQRKWGAGPRESYAMGDDSIKDQPFGIQVRNCRCVKCHRYGHINTDKECPLYGKAADSEAPAERVDQARLIDQMQEDGMKMRWSAWDMENTKQKRYDMIKDPNAKTEAQMDSAERKEEDEVKRKMKMIQSMSKEEKKKLLKKLSKVEKKGKKDKNKKKRDSSPQAKWVERKKEEGSDRKDKHKKRRSESSDDADVSRAKKRSDSSEEEDRHRKKSRSHDADENRRSKKRERKRSDGSNDDRPRRERSADRGSKTKERRRHRSDSSDGDRRRRR